MKEATLYVQGFDLTAWLLAQVGGCSVLGRQIHSDAMLLLDHLVLALKGVDRISHIEEADATNALLRVRLRLGLELGLIDERQLLFCTGQLDQIGRQLGGWLRQLERGTTIERHR